MFSPTQLVPGMDQATMMSVLNNNFRQIEAENRTKVIRDEDGVNRVLIGRSQDGKYSLRVSGEGDDVLTTPESDLIFNSSNNLFKIVESGEVTLNMPEVLNGTSSSYVSDFVEHNLSYAPMVIAFITIPNTQSVGSQTRMFGTGAAQARSVSTSAVTIGYLSDEIIETSAPVGPNKGRVSFSWRVSNATGLAQPAMTAKIKYYLLTETAA